MVDDALCRLRRHRYAPRIDERAATRRRSATEGGDGRAGVTRGYPSELAPWKGPNGWIAGQVVGHNLTKNWEIDAEIYNSGTYGHGGYQNTFDMGARYKIRPSFILLLMAAAA